jgi:hypothetical protein
MLLLFWNTHGSATRGVITNMDYTYGICHSHIDFTALINNIVMNN